MIPVLCGRYRLTGLLLYGYDLGVTTEVVASDTFEAEFSPSDDGKRILRGRKA